MADTQHVKITELTKSFARHINGLADDSKFSRRKAVEAIGKELRKQAQELSSSEYQLLFEDLVKPLLKVFSDPIEKCRELTILIVYDSIGNLEKPQQMLHFIVPLLVQRLGQQEIVEPSEELRLELVKSLSKLIEVCGKNITIFLNDVVQILQQTITDPYPEVKKESCRCASKLAKTIPESFQQQSESLIKPLCESISHQHSKVRIEVVLAIGMCLFFTFNLLADDKRAFCSLK